MKKFIYTVAITVSLIIAGLLMLVFTYKAWATYPTEYLGGKPVYFYEDDEFIGGLTTSGSIGKQGWVHDGGTATITTSATTNSPGAIDFTHTTAGASRLLCLKDCAANTGVFDFSYNFDTTVIVSFPTCCTPGYLMYSLYDNPANTNKIGFSSNNTSSWHAQCTGCAGSPVNLNVTINANTWYKLRIKKTGTSVEFYIDDVLKTTLTTTAAGDFAPIFLLNWDTTQRTMSIDYWNFIIPSSGR